MIVIFARPKVVVGLPLTLPLPLRAPGNLGAPLPASPKAHVDADGDLITVLERDVAIVVARLCIERPEVFNSCMEREAPVRCALDAVGLEDQLDSAPRNVFRVSVEQSGCRGTGFGAYRAVEPPAKAADWGRSRGNGGSGIVRPVTPSPSSASTQTSLRAPKRTCWQKMDDVLTTYGFESLREFLSVLFHPRKRGEKDHRTKSHRQTVSAFLKGQSKITMAHIIPLIFNHSRSRPRKRDTDQHSSAFSPSRPLSEIRYARPCLSAWATRLVGDHIYYQVGKLARKSRTDTRSRRHLRATTNKRTNSKDVIEWEDVAFSVEELAALTDKRTSFCIQVGAISSFITSRNRYASGDLGLPLGLWLFRLSSSHLSALQEQVRDATARGEVDFGKISDNVQRYERVFEHGLGKENVLKHGTACTAFGLDNCKPDAFHAADHIARVINQERQSMTVETIYSSIDWEHMDNITDLHFVRVIANFSPHLNHLSSQVSARFRTTLAKHRLEPRKTRLQPLGTNTEQQMENKGYQAGFRDFDKQMGIEPENPTTCCRGIAGDGGTHGTLTRLKHIQVTTKNIYASYRNAISTPETWHTKSTQLCASSQNRKFCCKNNATSSTRSGGLRKLNWIQGNMPEKVPLASGGPNPGRTCDFESRPEESSVRMCGVGKWDHSQRSSR
ncbi:hypothetical protein B0H14DRAFT_3171882 [Mycena olivaceomarginata]|nr:hypothetical protein B0H14DRAFT_3171882 [Mycena olivaceomarginata]